MFCPSRVCVYIYIYVCIYVNIYICMYIYICMHVCMYVYIYMYVCMYIYMYVYIYIIIYLYNDTCTHFFDLVALLEFTNAYLFLPFPNSSTEPFSNEWSGMVRATKPQTIVTVRQIFVVLCFKDLTYH